MEYTSWVTGYDIFWCKKENIRKFHNSDKKFRESSETDLRMFNLQNRFTTSTLEKNRLPYLPYLENIWDGKIMKISYDKEVKHS